MVSLDSAESQRGPDASLGLSTQRIGDRYPLPGGSVCRYAPILTLALRSVKGVLSEIERRLSTTQKEFVGEKASRGVWPMGVSIVV